MKKGKFVIISGPSGVGKDTICNELVKKGVGRYSVSMTTRKKRSNEIEGISYFFVSKEEFERHIEEDYFLEYAMYNGNYYGTPNEFIKGTTNNGNNVIAVLEIKGAINAKRIFSNAITIDLGVENLKMIILLVRDLILLKKKLNIRINMII